MLVTKWTYRGIAQLVEYWSPKPWVVGSSPSAPAIEKGRCNASAFFYGRKLKRKDLNKRCWMTVRGTVRSARTEVRAKAEMSLGFCGVAPRPSPSAPAKNRQVSTCRFFIHCESNGISSRGTRVSHHRRCISSAAGCIFFRNDDIQHSVLMICKTPSWWYTRLRRDLFAMAENCVITLRRLV